MAKVAIQWLLTVIILVEVLVIEFLLLSSRCYGFQINQEYDGCFWYSGLWFLHCTRTILPLHVYNSNNKYHSHSSYYIIIAPSSFGYTFQANHSCPCYNYYVTILRLIALMPIRVHPLGSLYAYLKGPIMVMQQVTL